MTAAMSVQAGEVRIKCVATALCHTDSYTLDGLDPEGEGVRNLQLDPYLAPAPSTAAAGADNWLNGKTLRRGGQGR